jgi:hypothetical protein
LFELLREGSVEGDDGPGDLDRCPIDRGDDEIGAVLSVVLPELERSWGSGDDCISRDGCARRG